LPNGRSVLVLLVTVLLTACQPDARFRTVGAGPDLYAPEAVANTAEVLTYFNLLCARAGLAPVPIPPTPPACNISNWDTRYWRVLVAAGFNDIDTRCDNYLGWLLAKRNERLFTNQTLAAITALLGGLTVATGAAEAIGYVGLALGLGTTMYNAYQETLLNGLETATIIKTVEARRTQFRVKFQNATIIAQPDAEYVLRSYLRICTPASIIMDANTAALLLWTGPAGEPVVPPQARQLDEQSKALLNYKPITPATPVTQRSERGPIRTPDIVQQVFVDPATMNQLRNLQAGLCIPEEDRGKLGANTIANINLWNTRSESAASAVTIDKKIDRATYGRILQQTGGGICDLARYQNIWENWKYHGNPDAEKALLESMSRLFTKDTTAAPMSFGSARDLIGRAREKCGLNNKKQTPFVNQVTPDLETKLRKKQCGSEAP
jgi:hypothetical protein